MADNFAAFLDKFAVLQPEPELPEVKPSLTTFYYPETPENTRKAGLSYSMEGGIQGGAGFSDLDLRNHTLEKFREGKSEYVAVAAAGRPTGEMFRMVVDGTPIVAKRVDTGGGLVPGQIDVASGNPDLARGGIEHGEAYTGPYRPRGEVEASGEGGYTPTPIEEPVAPSAEPQAAPTPSIPAPQATPYEGTDYRVAAAPPVEIPTEVEQAPLIGQTPPAIPDAFNQEVEQSVSQPAPESLVAASGNVDFSAFLQKYATPTPAPTAAPAATPAASPSANFSNFLAKYTSPSDAGPPKEAGALKKLGKSILAYGGEMIGQGGAQTFKEGLEAGGVPTNLNPETLAKLIPNVGPVIENVQHIRHRASQVQEAEKTPPFSQERFNAGSAVVLDMGQLATGAAGVGKLSPKSTLSRTRTKAVRRAIKEPTGLSQKAANPLEADPVVQMGRREIASKITGKGDSVHTLADYEARQLVGDLRQDFGQTPGKKLDPKSKAAKDLDAATFVEEAGGDPVELSRFQSLIDSSKSKKLAGKYGPVIDYAIKNLDRLKTSGRRYQGLMKQQATEDAAAGLTYGQRQQYATHVLKGEPQSGFLSFFTEGSGGGGGFSKYFTKNREFNSLAEAINAGIEPASVNLADLAQHRITASKRLIINKEVFTELRSVSGPDGKPAVAQIGKSGDPPYGYEKVHANGIDLAVHPDYAGIFRALYGTSAFRQGKLGRAIMKTAGVQKAYTLAADTFHGFRGLYKGLFYGKGQGRFGYEKGTSVYEMSDSALDRAVQMGDLSKSQAKWAKDARPALESMLKEGLNVSRFADNIVEQMHVTFPGTRGLNDWIFQRVFRGAMVQASHANYLRNMKRFGPGSGKGALTAEQIARKTSIEMNEVFGNLGSQGLFRDKTVRDAMNVAFLAPQWVESQVRAEFRGYGQWANVVPDALKGKFRVGAVAQGQATAVAAFLAGNQIINYATTGHSTFENPEGHKLSAYVPIGHGVYIDPLALSAEYAGRFAEVMERQGKDASIPGVVTEMVKGKASPFGRSAITLATGRDWRGRPLKGGDLYQSAALDLIPLPIFASSVVQKDPTADYGITGGIEADKIVQQLLQSAGLRAKVDYPRRKKGVPVFLGQ